MADFWAAQAPPVGNDLVVLSEDENSRGVRLDDERLRKVLWSFRDHVRAAGDRMAERVQDEVGSRCSKIKGELMVFMSERFVDCETQLFPRHNELEGAVELLGTTLDTLKSKVEEQAERIEALHREGHHHRRHSSCGGRRASLGGRRASSASAPQPQDIETTEAVEDLEGAVTAETDLHTSTSAQDVELVENAAAADVIEEDQNASGPEIVEQEGAELTALGTSDDEDSASFDSMEDIREELGRLQEQVEELRNLQGLGTGTRPVTRLSKPASSTRPSSPGGRDLYTPLSPAGVGDFSPLVDGNGYAELKYQLRCLDQKLDGEIAEVEAHLRRIREVVFTSKREGDAVVADLVVERGRIDDVVISLAKLASEDSRLQNQKAELEALLNLQNEVAYLRQSMASFAPAASTEDRFTRLERGAQKLGGTLHRADAELILVKQQQAHLLSKLQNTIEADRSSMEWVREQLAATVRHSCEVVERVEALEVTCVQLNGHLQHSAPKADLADVMELKNAVGRLARESKEKPPPVLFGAKCLSCNRVRDDAEAEAGSVDVRGDRQRAQLYSEVQRALQSPQCDPLKPIKMIAVRVGRPGGLTSATTNGAVTASNRGMALQGRDGTSISCAVEDMQLISMRPSSVASGAVGESVSTPRPPSRQKRSLVGDGAVAGGVNAPVTPPRLKAGVACEPKMTLSHLLAGRGGGAS